MKQFSFLFCFFFYINLSTFGKGQKMFHLQCMLSIYYILLLQQRSTCRHKHHMLGSRVISHPFTEAKRIWTKQRSSPTEHRGRRPHLFGDIAYKESAGFLPSGCCRYRLWSIFSYGLFAFEMEPFFLFPWFYFPQKANDETQRLGVDSSRFVF